MTLQSASTRSYTKGQWAPYRSEFGRGWVAWDEDGALCRTALPGLPEPPGRSSAPPPRVAAAILEVKAALQGRPSSNAGTAYLARASRTPLDAAIYSAVAAIPPGRTATYAEVAAQVGRPGAARAVGAAMARNPFAPLIPCHRVVGSDGSLRGYGGGITMKRRLLDLEGAHAG